MATMTTTTPTTTTLDHEETKELLLDTTLSVSSFDEMNLRPDVLRGIYSYGFESPSVIQQRGICPFITGTDLIAQSQSGTGKTGTFVIGALQRVDPLLNCTQALILVPIRELAKQIHTVIQSIGSHIPGLSYELAIGGVRSKYQSKWSVNEEQSHIVIGTPGRVLDNLQRKRLKLDHLKMVILDEADEMLSRGFIDQVHNIFQFTPSTCQVALFSATMPPEVLEITSKFMKEPTRILVKKEELTLDGIRQFYVALEHRDYKYDVVMDLFETISVTQCIIYTNTKKTSEYLHDRLTQNNFSAGLITGNMSQDDRNQVMKDFRQGTTRVLITTDMLARGIDVQQVSLVLNFDLPREKETYIHRIGRSGRFGRKGIAINLITNDDHQSMKELQQFYCTQIDELPANISDLL